MREMISAQVSTLKDIFKERSAFVFLILLICGDCAFVVLHLINHFAPADSHNPMLSVSFDNGYAETYQYLKYLWIVIALVFTSLKEFSLRYLSWALVFAYFLADDSLQIHESAGRYVAARLAFEPVLGLRLQDIGELAFSGTVGSVFLVFLALAYRNGPARFQKMSLDLSVLVLVLVFFGVGIDMAHSAIDSGARVRFVLGMLEDGGEMLSASLILWYAFLTVVRERHPDRYLCDHLRIFPAKRIARPSQVLPKG